MKLVKSKLIVITSIIFPTFLIGASDLLNNSLENILNEEIEIKANLGSREEAKNFLNSRSPVDVITATHISDSGQTNLTDLLKYYVAGFNAIESSVSDGSDHLTGFTLRGMSSDQILVLVNGKRLHTSAMVHEVGVISRGTSHVDLNIIPLNAIQKIEILRDAAAAQYGTDAISGIINITLKEKNNSNLLELHTGVRKAGDGNRYQVDSFTSLPLKYDGFANLALSVIQQDETQRAGKDRRVSPPELHTHIGIPEYKKFSGIFNSEIVSENDSILYSNAILSYKDSASSAFYRTPDVTRPIYPDGFLPIINAKILDYSLGLGIKDTTSDLFSWDISNVYGYNNFHYFINDSLNYELGANSPTSFDAGDLTFIQNTTNLDLKKSFNNFTLTGGLEYRYEKYMINAGETASYSGTGSQGFAGFSSDNNTQIDRKVYAFYADMIHNISEKFSYELAGRYEHYNDFGATNDYKLSLGYNVIQELFLRGSASSGFRAPSLSQSGYTHTSSFATDSGLALSGIFQPNHQIAQALGAKELKPEDSLHYTVGTVYQYNNNLSLMIDYFYTKVNDRILLSDKQNASTPEQQSIFDSYGVSSASYFTNAIDTRTQGVDIKLDTKLSFTNSSTLNSVLWFHYNETKITSYNQEVFYLQTQKIEHSQPRDTIRLLNNYKTDTYNLTLNISRLGSYYHVLGTTPYKFNETITTDLDLSYEVNKNLNISLGGNNIFNTMPDKWEGRSNPYLGYDGILPYSNNSPIGYSGAYYYVKARLVF